MSQDSNELFLKIESQKTNENPYKKDDWENYMENAKPSRFIKKRESKLSRKKNIQNYEVYQTVYPHSHLLLIFSIFLTCLFYSIVVNTKSNFFVGKYYHSICLGLFSLLDLLINRTQFSFNFLMSDENSDQDLNENLLNENKKFDVYSVSLSNKNFYVFSIILGVISFVSELLIFYLLKITKENYHYNIGICFSLLASELIMIRMYYSFYDVKIAFLNFVGLLTILFLMILISLSYFNVYFLTISILIAILRFSKFFVFNEVSNYKSVNMYKFTLITNFFDFLVGGALTFVFMFKSEEGANFHLMDFVLIAIATLCFYINTKYFRDWDRYGICISSLSYLLIVVLDLFINRHRIDLPQLLLIILLYFAIVVSYIGDKLFDMGSKQKKSDKRRK